MEWLANVHSIWRWVVLLLGLAAIVLAVMAATGSRPWDSITDRLSFFFTLALDIQFLIGVLVWITKTDWTDADNFVRWIHPLAMIAAIAVAHIGRVRADRAQSATDKGRQAALFFITSLVIILIAIPLSAWPL